jgi:signal transduction histidine kinase
LYVFLGTASFLEFKALLKSENLVKMLHAKRKKQTELLQRSRQHRDFIVNQDCESMDKKALKTIVKEQQHEAALLRARIAFLEKQLLSSLESPYQPSMAEDLPSCQSEPQNFNYNNPLVNSILAMISHELRTPLNTIIGFSELMLDKTLGDITSSQTEALEKVSDAGHHLLHFINNMIDLSLLKADRLMLNYSIFEVESIISQNLDTFRSKAAAKKIIFEEEVSTQNSFLYGDPQRFNQIIDHLVDNAIKFTPQGGKIGIRTRSLHPDIEIVVWDTGVGISQDDLAAIFEPFTQLNSSLARTFSGIGLGLSLVKNLVTLHKGTIDVESKPGSGSAFILNFTATTPTHFS